GGRLRRELEGGHCGRPPPATPLPGGPPPPGGRTGGKVPVPPGGKGGAAPGRGGARPAKGKPRTPAAIATDAPRSVVTETALSSCGLCNVEGAGRLGGLTPRCCGRSPSSR